MEDRPRSAGESVSAADDGSVGNARAASGGPSSTMVDGAAAVSTRWLFKLAASVTTSVALAGWSGSPWGNVSGAGGTVCIASRAGRVADPCSLTSTGRFSRPGGVSGGRRRRSGGVVEVSGATSGVCRGLPRPSRRGFALVRSTGSRSAFGVAAPLPRTGVDGLDGWPPGTFSAETTRAVVSTVVSGRPAGPVARSASVALASGRGSTGKLRTAAATRAGTGVMSGASGDRSAVAAFGVSDATDAPVGAGMVGATGTSPVGSRGGAPWPGVER